jgi:hypothetical protein
MWRSHKARQELEDEFERVYTTIQDLFQKVDRATNVGAGESKISVGQGISASLTSRRGAGLRLHVMDASSLRFAVTVVCVVRHQFFVVLLALCL